MELSKAVTYNSPDKKYGVSTFKEISSHQRSNLEYKEDIYAIWEKKIDSFIENKRDLEKEIRKYYLELIRNYSMTKYDLDLLINKHAEDVEENLFKVKQYQEKNAEYAKRFHHLEITCKKLDKEMAEHFDKSEELPTFSLRNFQPAIPTDKDFSKRTKILEKLYYYSRKKNYTLDTIKRAKRAIYIDNLLRMSTFSFISAQDKPFREKPFGGFYTFSIKEQQRSNELRGYAVQIAKNSLVKSFNKKFSSHEMKMEDLLSYLEISSTILDLSYSIEQAHRIALKMASLPSLSNKNRLEKKLWIRFIDSNSLPFVKSMKNILEEFLVFHIDK